MGKGALILAMASSLLGSVLYISQKDARVEMDSVEADSEFRTLARMSAESGFEVILSKVRNDFEGHRGSWTIQLDDGSYTISASGPAAGPVTLTARGEVGDESFEITASASKGQTRILDALILDGELKKFKFKNTVTISGMDTNPNGTDAGSSDVHAILTTDASAKTTVLDELGSGDAPGVGGSPDVVSGAPVISLSALADAILGYSGSARIYYDEDAEFEDGSIGSPTNPKVVIVDGDVDMEDDFVGYGVLYVGGKLEMKDNARWEGLVLVERNGGKHKMDKDAAIYGSLVIRTVASTDEDSGDSGGDAGLPGGHFDVDVFDEPNSTDKLYHEHKYDDDYNTTGIDLLNPGGCKTNGGLCWDSIMPGEGAVFVEFLNPTRGYGTYTIDAGLGLYGTHTVPAVDVTGRVEDDLPTMFMLASDQLNGFTVNFDYLCALQISSPGDSIDDPVDRNGAFAVRMYRGDKVGTTWQKGELVYEVSVYHHTGYGMYVNEGGTMCDPTSGGGGGEEVVVAAGEEMEVDFKKNAVIQYSSLALSRLSTVLPMVNPASTDILLADIRQGFIR